MKNLRYTISCLFMVALFLASQAQTYEEYKKQESESFNKYKAEQEKEIKKLAKEFDDYVKKADLDFANFLKKEWEQHQVSPGIKIPISPKPVIIPEVKPEIKIAKLPPKKIPIVVPTEKKTVEFNRPILPIIQKSEEDDFLKTTTGIDFYGTNFSFQFDDEISKLSTEIIDSDAIANWWLKCSKTKYNNLINELFAAKNRLNLNDWAYFTLVKKTAGKIAGNEQNTSELLTWFLMLRSGYNFKIAFNDTGIFLMFPTENTLPGKTYLVVKNENFYFDKDRPESTSFYTYDYDFEGANRKIDFMISQPLNIGNDIYKKEFTFNHDNVDYIIPVNLSVNNIYFLKDYPNTNLDVYFNSAISRSTKESLAEAFIPYLKGFTTNESVNFILAFVQKAFKYSTDNEQFGHENYFFPEEVFYHAASDCEDRAALFSYMIENLLNLEVIGLKYKGHVAAAVNTNTEVSGDYIVYNNTKYVITDPTYINACMGLTMPKYKNSEATVIDISNTNYLAEITNNCWDITRGWGGNRGSNMTDAVVDKNGNCYLTGYYTNNVNYGDLSWSTNNSNRKAFIAKYDKNKNMVWANNIVAKGVITAFSLTLDDKGNPLISGSFNGQINSTPIILSTVNNVEDIFVASYSPEGKLYWLEKSGLDTINTSEFLNYVLQFNSKGKSINSKLYFENEAPISNGIYADNNIVTIIGSFNSTTGFSTSNVSFDSESSFSTIEYLKSENDALIQNDVNSSIAGLFAVINLIKSSGMVIPGKEAQEALDKYNPSFKSNSPSIYENIGNVTFMKNNDGIINVQTNNGKSVSFDKIKISNGSTIKIASLQDGNQQINVLSGIEVGKAFIWYDLNFVKMLQKTGDLVFDYDTDHTQKTINMKDDILD